jgi:hypothetical protein
MANKQDVQLEYKENLFLHVQLELGTRPRNNPGLGTGKRRKTTGSPNHIISVTKYARATNGTTLMKAFFFG